MFETARVESRGLVASKTQKWSAAGSVALQCGIAALLIAIPMVGPQVLDVKAPAPQITVPNLKPVQLVQQAASSAVSAAAAMALPARAPVVENTRSLVFPLAHPAEESEAAPVGIGPMTMGGVRIRLRRWWGLGRTQAARRLWRGRERAGRRASRRAYCRECC